MEAYKLLVLVIAIGSKPACLAKKVKQKEPTNKQTERMMIGLEALTFITIVVALMFVLFLLP